MTRLLVTGASGSLGAPGETLPLDLRDAAAVLRLLATRLRGVDVVLAGATSSAPQPEARGA